MAEPLELPSEPDAPAVLAVDIGGSHVKMVAERRPGAAPVRLRAGPDAERDGRAASAGCSGTGALSVSRSACPRWCSGGRVVHEPVNLGPGWVGFDFAAAFGKPAKIVNDAAMQALGSYEGGRMLFLGLGTGLGSAHDRGGDRGADGARPSPVPQGDLRGLRRPARAREARQEALARGGERDDRDVRRRRSSPST